MTTARFAFRLRTTLLWLVLCALAPTLWAAPDPLTYPLGANLVPAAQGGGVVFRLWAPNATSVSVAGQFNSWSSSANPLSNSSGIWSGWVPAAVMAQQYKFVLNGTSWKIDPRARDTVNTTDNAIIRGDGSSYAWQATGWQTPDKDRLIIYELHVGSFSGNGDGVANYPAKYRDVIDTHLDELLALGVNMVEVMPIHEFPGGVSWGYNPVHFFAPESDLGDPDDLRYMIDKLHQNGISVMLDVVYNHTSNTDNNLWNFDGASNIYFFGANCQGSTPWGDTRPKYTDAQVRQFFVDNVTYWFKEFKIDGIRVDSTANMRGYCSELGEGWLLMGDLTDAARAVNPRAVCIAEELPNTAVVSLPRASSGAGYDAQWCDLFKNEMFTALGAIGSGGNPSMAGVANAIANSGWGGGNDQAVKYIESHDEAANGGRTPKRADPTTPTSAKALGLAKVAGGITLLAPGIPMLLQGQEFAEDKNFGDQTADRIWWGFLGTRAPIRDFFSTLCTLRKSRGGLRAGSGVQVTHVNDSGEVLAFQRYDSNGDVLFIVANFSATAFGAYQLGVPSAGLWYEIANSNAVGYGGSGTGVNTSLTAAAVARDGLPANFTAQLPAYALLVFSQNPTVPVEISNFIVE